MKPVNQPQPFISKAQRLNAELVELRNTHVNIIQAKDDAFNALKDKYTKQSKRLGGFVQSNANYRKMNNDLSDRNRLNLNVIDTLRGDLKIMSNRVDDKNYLITNLNEQVAGLRHDVKMAEENHDYQYNLSIEYGKQLAAIRSKWWFWLFNW